MNWDDNGFLLSKNKYSENSLIVDIFTKNHGKTSGIIFGGTSKKIKNYLQIGNKLFVNYVSKSDNKIGYFKAEICEVLSPVYFDQPNKLNCIYSAMNLIKLFTAESQSSTKIFNLICDFYLILSQKDWLKEYIFWELSFLSNLGYNLNLKEIAIKEIIDNKIIYTAKSSNDSRIIPNFLIDKNDLNHNFDSLLEGLKLVGDFMDKTILKPNNINFPISRNHFVQSLKKLNQNPI